MSAQPQAGRRWRAASRLAAVGLRVCSGAVSRGAWKRTTRGDAHAHLVAFAGHRAAEVLGELAGTLNEHGKERLVQACVELARADGAVDEAELDIAREVGAALLMSPAHVRGVIADSLERA